MQSNRLLKNLPALAAASAILAGCGASGLSPQFDRSAAMLPAAKTASEFLYVADGQTQRVDVFTYPDEKLVGTIPGLYSGETGFNLCTDKAGDVWVVGSGVAEFAPGGTKPIATLNIDWAATACAVDPKSGDLAVTTFEDDGGSNQHPGSVAIYASASGKPTYHQAPATLGAQGTGIWNYYNCVYDDSGNIFADGYDYNGNGLLVELPKGSKKFRTINVPQSGTQAVKRAGHHHVRPQWNPGTLWAGGLQWDGKYLAVGMDTGQIQRYAITTTSSATLEDTIALNGAFSWAWQFSVRRASLGGKPSERTILMSSTIRNKPYVGIWHYPAGTIITRIKIDSLKAPGPAVITAT